MKIFNTFKRKGIVSLLIVSLLLGLFSCDKEGDPNPPVNQEGGEIYQYQLVEINYPNELPEESEFEATLGEVPVTVTKTNEHTLKFVVPTNMPLGYAELMIPELNNTTVKYIVLAPQLVQTADETMESFMTSGATFFSTPNPTNSQFATAKGNFEQFQEYFAQHATSEEKKQMALFYQVNKPMIDDLIAFNPDNLSSRFTVEDVLIMTKFTTAVAISVGGAFSVLYVPEPSLKILGAAISGLAATRAIDFHDQLAARSIKVVLFDLGGLVGQSNRGIQNGVVVLQSDIAENINFQIGSRPLRQSDADSENTSLGNFFSSQASYNEMIMKLNSVITSINSTIPFFNLSTFDLASLETNPQTVNQEVTSEIMEDISFNINHPNLELVNATVSDEGQLNLKVKIVGEPASTPIASTLNYTYSDEIGSFSGSFPIELQEQVNLLIGDWVLVGVYKSTSSENSYTLVGQSSEPFSGVGYGFDQQYYIPISGNATFTPTSFTINTSLTVVTEGMIISNPMRLCDRTMTYNDNYNLDNYNYPQIFLNSYIEITNINSSHSSAESESCDNGDSNTNTSNSNNVSQRKIKLEDENTLLLENINSTGYKYKFIRQ